MLFPYIKGLKQLFPKFYVLHVCASNVFSYGMYNLMLIKTRLIALNSAKHQFSLSLIDTHSFMEHSFLVSLYLNLTFLIYL